MVRVSFPPQPAISRLVKLSAETGTNLASPERGPSPQPGANSSASSLTGQASIMSEPVTLQDTDAEVPQYTFSKTEFFKWVD